MTWLTAIPNIYIKIDLTQRLVSSIAFPEAEIPKKDNKKTFNIENLRKEQLNFFNRNVSKKMYNLRHIYW